MEDLRKFLILNIDYVILALYFLWILLDVFCDIWSRHVQDRELVEIFKAELNGTGNGSDLDKKASQIYIFLPFAVVSALILCGIHDMWVLFAILIVLMIVIVAYILRNFFCTVLLLGYSNIGALLQNVIYQSVFLIMWVILPNLLPQPSQVIPMVSWLGCAQSVFLLLRLIGSKSKDRFYIVPPESLLVLAFTQSILVLCLWAVGGYQFLRVLGYQKMAWSDWLKTIIFYQGDKFVEWMRYTGIGLSCILVFLLGYLTTMCKMCSENLKTSIHRMIPLGLFLVGIVTGGAYICNGTNYLRGLPAPLECRWGWTDGLAAYSEKYNKMDSEQAVLLNGTSFYLEQDMFRYGSSINVSVKPISDFSDRPYLRFYQETVYDGCLTIWVENQGGVDAENCQFQLLDEQGELGAHFSEGTLFASVQNIPAGERVCLFTLKNEEMLKSEYGEIPIELEVAAIFWSEGHRWKTIKTLPIDAMISMRGVTVEKTYQPRREGIYVSMEEPANWISDMNYRLNKLSVGDFYCGQTMLLEMRVVINHYGEDETELTPIIFVYEVP